MPIQAEPGIQVPQESAFHRREWRLERLGWAFITLVFLAALAGGLGTGPLSAAQTQAGSGRVELQYQAVTHREADDTLTVIFDSPPSGKADLVILGDWLENADIRSVSPEPASQKAVSGGLSLEIEAAAARKSTAVISMRLKAAGLVSGEVRIDGQSVQFSQLVLP